MPSPTLYVFAISHYCEKARWALDHYGIAYALEHLAPGKHAALAKQAGAPGTSVPWLRVEGEVVHGSATILDWAGERASGATPSLEPDAEHTAECRAIEARLDDVFGVHGRRTFYSEALLDDPQSVLPMFAADLTPEDRVTIENNWETVTKLMIGAMDLGPEQGEESLRIVEGELAWLDGLLSDGRSYLLGDRFSRADITAASLFALLALPPEHPTYARVTVPPRTRAAIDGWNDRPAIRFVREIYRKHRTPGA
jgi:glutathione S-transferase